MTKTGLYGSVSDFSEDYYAAPDDKIRIIHSYLMRKNNISCLDIRCLDLLKNAFLQQ